MMNCIIVDDDELSRILLGNLVEQHGSLNLKGSFPGAMEAAAVAHSGIDLIFLDVEMPEMSGLEFARSLGDRPQLIIVSGKTEYALDAIEVEVTDYLVKPVTQARFVRAVQRALGRHTASQPVAATSAPETKTEDPADRVFIKADGKLIQLELSEVLYIEAQADYMMIYTGQKNYLIHGTLKSMEQKLPKDRFARVHRSYIVNLGHIQDIKDASIVIRKSVIPIGGSHKARLMEKLNTL